MARGRATDTQINYVQSTTSPNEVITRLSAVGSICIYTLTATHVIVDVVGHN